MEAPAPEETEANSARRRPGMPRTRRPVPQSSFVPTRYTPSLRCFSVSLTGISACNILAVAGKEHRTIARFTVLVRTESTITCLLTALFLALATCVVGGEEERLMQSALKSVAGLADWLATKRN